eukprot:363769-Chlamydomonas_euryale.AAC.13
MLAKSETCRKHLCWARRTQTVSGQSKGQTVSGQSKGRKGLKELLLPPERSVRRHDTRDIRGGPLLGSLYPPQGPQIPYNPTNLGGPSLGSLGALDPAGSARTWKTDSGRCSSDRSSAPAWHTVVTSDCGGAHAGAPLAWCAGAGDGREDAAACAPAAPVAGRGPGGAGGVRADAPDATAAAAAAAAAGSSGALDALL